MRFYRAAIGGLWPGVAREAGGGCRRFTGLFFITSYPLHPMHPCEAVMATRLHAQTAPPLPAKSRENENFGRRPGRELWQGAPLWQHVCARKGFRAR